MTELTCPLRQSSQADGGEEVDGEASVSGVVPREEAFEERLQGPKKNTTFSTCDIEFKRLAVVYHGR